MTKTATYATKETVYLEYSSPVEMKTPFNLKTPFQLILLHRKKQVGIKKTRTVCDTYVQI